MPATTTGTLITEVGRCLWTGTGKSGSPAGNGNSDYLVGSDGTHPTVFGHRILAEEVARQIMAQLSRH